MVFGARLTGLSSFATTPRRTGNRFVFTLRVTSLDFRRDL